MDGKDWWKNSTTERDTHCNVSNYAEVLQYSLQALPYWERDTNYQIDWNIMVRKIITILTYYSDI